MKENLDKKKVLLGLSGGVDSTTAALLLKEKGYRVTGYYFDVLGNNKRGEEEARAVAEQLGIPLIAEDVSKEFSDVVIENFCHEYLKGRTPNPCVICNPNIKFKKLIETANRIGAYYIATGHYCRIEKDADSGKYYVKRGANEKKDQSYMLYRLGQDVLSRLIFPLGEFDDKARIREIAAGNKMDNADKKDSQEICFVDPSESYVDFIKKAGIQYAQGEVSGHFVDKDGNVLGEHKGILNYTVGQRKGLGIALGKPAFVVRLDCEKNQVVIGDNEDLFTNRVVCKDYFFCDDDKAGAGEHIQKERQLRGIRHPYDGAKVTAKIRYAAQPATAVLKIEKDRITAIFDEPQRAPAPGQSIVFYIGDRVIGGGFIQ